MKWKLVDWIGIATSYEDLKDNQALLTIAYWASKIGLLWYFPESFTSKRNADRKWTTI